MGLWDRIRGWLGDGPERVPDVASFADARLRQLWKDRDELTDVAREAVRAECVRRGLRLRGLAPVDAAAARAPQTDDGASQPVASGNVIDVRVGLGVLLQTTPGRFALIVLPRWSPAAIEPPKDLPLDAIIVCNHEPRGWLDASRLAAATGVRAENVYATAKGPIDRAPGASSGEAKVLPSELALGNLALRRMDGLRNVLRATWRGAAATAAIGPTLPAALVEAQPASHVYVGSLPEPDAKPAWSALLAAAHASSMMAATGLGPRASGPTFLLVGDAVGAALRRHTHLRPGFGITVVGGECPVAPDAVSLLGDVLEGRWAQIGAASSAQVEDVMEHLVVEARIDDARRLIDRVLEADATDATTRRLDATMRALAGEHDEALAILVRAESDSFSFVVAAAVHAARRDWTEAEASARRALASAPSDPDVLAALVRCLWLAGRTDDARQVIDDAPAFSLTGTQASDLYAIIAREPPSERSSQVALPHLAARALAVARRSQDRELAMMAHRRAIELDPHCAAALEALAAMEAASP